MRNPVLDEADAALVRDDIQLAEKLFRQCLEEEPENGEALRELALIEYGFKKNSLKARELIEHSLSLEDSPWAHLYRGIILNDLGVNPQAEEELKHAVEASGGLAVFHSMFGDILAAHGRHEEAKLHFLAALSKEPDYEPAQKSLARQQEFLDEKKSE